MIDTIPEKIRTPIAATIAGTVFNHLALIFSDETLRILGGISYTVAIVLGLIKIHRYLQSLKKHADSI